MTKPFFDSNILVYAFSDDPRAETAYRLLLGGGTISVQCLNELANVLRRKQRMEWAEVTASIDAVCVHCPTILALDTNIHRLGLTLADRYQFAIYDAMIVAAALSAQCDTLYSEDMHDGLVVEDRLRIVNPFA